MAYPVICGVSLMTYGLTPVSGLSLYCKRGRIDLKLISPWTLAPPLPCSRDQTRLLCSRKTDHRFEQEKLPSERGMSNEHRANQGDSERSLREVC